MLHAVRHVERLHPIVIGAIYAVIGLFTFLVTALISGESAFAAWNEGGVRALLLWAYEGGSIWTLAVLFLVSMGSAVLPRKHGLVGAVSLTLFFPAFAIYRLATGTYTGSLLPYEFAGYLFLIVVCLIGYLLGRWLVRRIGSPARGA